MFHRELREFGKLVHSLARAKGWWDNDPKDTNSILAKLALIHTEVSEAVEAVRDGKITQRMEQDKFGQMKPEGLEAELADVVIR